ncbi:MAG: FIST C-terminal domain-containing protein [Candidatus Omnitrophica bacterium]|nr:FIST C-terminal domain-containing protein [Candidatus Omnitrophota bacterium]
MSTSISIGFSQHPDPQKAVLQACVQLKNQLNTTNTDLVVVFASPDCVTGDMPTTITRTLRPKHLVGCSTGGIILANGMVNRGIVMMGLNSTDMSCGISAVTSADKRDTYLTGVDLAYRAAQNLYEFHQREVFITFSQGIERDFSQFIRGARESVGAGFPIIGALASDAFAYKNISQFFQDQILYNGAVGLMLGGPLKVGVGCRHGFKPLGKPRTITQVEGHIIRSIDDKPAVDIYRHFLGTEADGMKSSPLNSYAALYPLGILLEEPRQYLLRNPIDILTDGSIVCHEGIPQGAQVHLMISNVDSCLDSAVQAAQTVKASLEQRPPHLIMVIESLARHKLLGRDAFRETQMIRDVIGHTVPLIGMCSYGEIGPLGINDIKSTHLHNESILIMAIS